MNLNGIETERINNAMAGWTIMGVAGGDDEDVFVFTLAKNGEYKTVTLCATELGGWLKDENMCD